MEATISARESARERYRRFRGISNRHANEALRRVPGSLILEWAKRLGLLAKQRVLLADRWEELCLLFDLAIYAKRLARTTVIEQYRNSADVPEGSEEGTVLDAMCETRLAFLSVLGPHPEAGLIVKDLAQQEELWLMDGSLEKSARQGLGIATRLFRPEDFYMTTGVLIPLEPSLVLDLIRRFPSPAEVPGLLEGKNPRLIEAMYKTAIAYGVMEHVEFR